MSTLGTINILEYLKATKGTVRGTIFTDAKNRIFSSDYKWTCTDDDSVVVSRADGHGDAVKIKQCIELDEGLISFFGLYSGDGAKGVEDAHDSSVLKPFISFSQRESNLVGFAAQQFRKLFPNNIRFTFSLGEDSALFMAGAGAQMLAKYYKGSIPKTPLLQDVRKKLNDADRRYLSEKRSGKQTNEEYLAFYYFHKDAMQEILTDVKKDDIRKCNIVLASGDKITASLRRPFKKGAREPGGSSRSDEMHVGGLNGFGELFLKILYEIENSVLSDTKNSTQGLISWKDVPSKVGELVKLKDFFLNSNYGTINCVRPDIEDKGGVLVGRWPRSKFIELNKEMRIDPLFCYVSGLYLAEGSTPKSALFAMYSQPVGGFSLSFTSSENNSLELVLRSLQKIFKKDDCVNTWKIKVGSQYFPELVVIGLKNGVPMLRGGKSGDGKLRTMEISLSVKTWALDVAPALLPFEHLYSHVEPTGAGLARIDFSASSVLCRWFFPLIMYATFGEITKNPKKDFINV